jgi:glycosyltransferase involved in cell wall biosynthesis
MERISIIIPAWNEEERIEKTLKSYINSFKKDFTNFEVIVVTDGSEDATPKIVERLSKKYDCIRHVHPDIKLGKGGAIIEGFKLASGDIIGFVDADCSTPPASIKLLIENLDNCDGVIASRWANGSTVGKKQPFARRVASRTFNLLVRILFGFEFEDTQCGTKFFRKDAIKSVTNELGLTDWAFDIDLLYRLHKKNYLIKEIPIAWNDQTGSKLDLGKTSIKMFFSVIGLRVKTSRLAFLAKSRVVKWLYKKVKSL